MSTPDRIPQIDPAEAARLAEQGALLLDVREPGEWDAGHAPEAVHLPFGRVHPDAVSGGRVVVAVCRSGNRSGTAAVQLAAAGVDVRNLAGGMKAWAAAGLPVVLDNGQPGTVG
ncbi:rhodanese-like domain-containing protein [Pseudonocardia sp. H11422]|uniref:rhodanese-like domain-containing protein n=1 Tax=Pseudonocardia sp. H11422 TaxID=2835866 RepID=UPI001BDD43E9|nr:rhodanese-like domain-containing protein [Pseudonocardia sp. H11422]